MQRFDIFWKSVTDPAERLGFIFNQMILKPKKKDKKSIRLRIADARRVAENILKRNGIYGYGGGCGDLGKYDMDRILNTTDEEAIRSDWESVIKW